MGKVEVKVVAWESGGRLGSSSVAVGRSWEPRNTQELSYSSYCGRRILTAKIWSGFALRTAHRDFFSRI
jgi:hypothetical protein